MPRQGEALLDGLFRRLGLVNEARAWRALAAWPRAAGEELSRRTRAERLQGTTLVVRVTSSSWANELGYLKAGLLAKLRATPGGEGVTDLRFQPGPLDDIPVASPAVRSSGEEAKAPISGGATVPEDPAIEKALGEIADPEVREELRRLIASARRS